jgi:hypothetical protein
MGAACPEIRTILTVEEAEAVIEPYFLAVQEVFVGNGATKCKRVRLEIAPWIHDSPRHFAATEDTGKVMVVSPEFTELPEETVVAILSHEFGHAVDFLYPSEYQLVDDGELVRLPPVPAKLIDKKAEQANLARMRKWEKRDKDAVERTADAIAEMYTGKRIGYCGPCELQCFNRGRRPRRPGLR